MATIQKGKSLLTPGQEVLTINFSKSFTNIPVVNVSCKDENVNLFIDSITINNFKVYASNVTNSNVEINYIAIEKNTGV